MNITTKFKIGDKVYRLYKSTAERATACSVCNDTKQVEIKGTLFKCPNCERGTNKYSERWFVHTEATTIGQIRIEVTLKAYHNSNYFDEDEIQGDEGSVKEQYMLAATGIGSGSLWEHSHLFLSFDDAEIECNKRNEVLIKNENALPK